MSTCDVITICIFTFSCGRYEQWKKKAKRGVRDVVRDDDGDDGEGGDAAPAPKKGKSGRNTAPPRDELKSFDEMVKGRTQDEKNRIKNKPGGFKAFNKENKGTFEPQARSHKGGGATRGMLCANGPVKCRRRCMCVFTCCRCIFVVMLMLMLMLMLIHAVAAAADADVDVS